MDVLIIYQFCSFGGVERMLLNRAMAFKKHDQHVVMFVGYLYDYGALQAFKEYIHLHHLDKILIPFLMPSDFLYNSAKYDLILVIDTPQVLDRIASYENVYLECHTPYVENRQYLKDISEAIKGIIVPSMSFKFILLAEFPNLPKVYIIPNTVSDEFFHMVVGREIFAKRPLTHLARIDDLKNISETIQIFQSLKDRNDVMHIIIGNGATDKNMTSSLMQMGILGNTLIRDKIDFAAVPNLINIVKQHRGIFISSSKGESFGLSAAEFISGGVPVLLSDIPPHRELVDKDNRFLYDVGDIVSARNKMTMILNDWESMSAIVGNYGSKFGSENFIAAWVDFTRI